VGGTFTTAGGLAATNIAKGDGSRWSSLGSGLNGAVYALAVFGSNLYVGGLFTTAGGLAATNIARWDGGGWSALGSGVNGIPGTVRSFAMSGGDVYVGGQFTTAGGSLASYIAKWDGSAGAPLGSGLDDYVYALAMSGSDLYVGGNFTSAGGRAAAFVARAYLLPPLPTLSVLRSGADATVSWPSAYSNDFALEQANALAAPASWVSNSASVSDDGTNKWVTVPATKGAQFFRLRRP